MNDSLSVKNMLNDNAYELLNLPTVEFEFGNLEFVTKDNIDIKQLGYRYYENGEVNNIWPSEYIIIGFDSAAGFGTNLYLAKINEVNMPVYLLLADDNISDVIKISNSLQEFSDAIKSLDEYKESFKNTTLSLNEKIEAYSKVMMSIKDESLDEYWDNLLDVAVTYNFDLEKDDDEDGLYDEDDDFDDNDSFEDDLSDEDDDIDDNDSFEDDLSDEDDEDEV